MAGPGMWMPTRRDGLNWQVAFTVVRLSDGETVSSVKRFRVRADAYRWIAQVKLNSAEARQVREPSFADFEYTLSKINRSK